VDPDRGLVEAAAGGDREAFDELVRRYQGAIVSLIRSLTGGGADGEDLAQEVFVRAWRSVAGFRGDSTFRTWLHRIAVNVVRTHHGRSSRLRRWLQPAPSGESEMADPIEAAADASDLETDVMRRDAIDRALAAIPAEMREAVVLRDVQGLDYREIADALGVPIGTVESRIFRGRQRLRSLLEPLMSSRGAR
jgi:RNA polymerase sigma-70 factor (ECF subfamily)